MNDLSLFKPGTWVWVKLHLTPIWWPGEIIALSSISKQLLEEHTEQKRKSVKIAVCFKTENSIELVMNWNKVCHYSCDRKLMFLKTGYTLYLKQKNNGRKIFDTYDMSDFVKDVIQIEKCIGGNINIFDQILKKEETEKEKDKFRQHTIKELFITDKEKKKRDLKRRLKQLMNEKSNENENKNLESEKTISKKKSTVTERSPKTKVTVSSENNSCLQAFPLLSKTQNSSKIKNKEDKPNAHPSASVLSGSGASSIKVNLRKKKSSSSNSSQGSVQSFKNNFVEPNAPPSTSVLSGSGASSMEVNLRKKRSSSSNSSQGSVQSFKNNFVEPNAPPSTSVLSGSDAPSMEVNLRKKRSSSSNSSQGSVQSFKNNFAEPNAPPSTSVLSGSGASSIKVNLRKKRSSSSNSSQGSVQSFKNNFVEPNAPPSASVLSGSGAPSIEVNLRKKRSSSSNSSQGSVQSFKNNFVEPNAPPSASLLSGSGASSIEVNLRKKRSSSSNSSQRSVQSFKNNFVEPNAPPSTSVLSGSGASSMEVNLRKKRSSSSNSSQGSVQSFKNNFVEPNAPPSTSVLSGSGASSIEVNLRKKRSSSSNSSQGSVQSFKNNFVEPNAPPSASVLSGSGAPSIEVNLRKKRSSSSNSSQGSVQSFKNNFVEPNAPPSASVLSGSGAPSIEVNLRKNSSSCNSSGESIQSFKVQPNPLVNYDQQLQPAGVPLISKNLPRPPSNINFQSLKVLNKSVPMKCSMLPAIPPRMIPVEEPSIPRGICKREVNLNANVPIRSCSVNRPTSMSQPLIQVATYRNCDTNNSCKTPQIVESINKSLTSVNQSSVILQQNVDNSFVEPKFTTSMVDSMNKIPDEFSLNSAVSLIPTSPPMTTNNLPSEVSPGSTCVSQEIIDLTGPDELFETKLFPCEICLNIFSSVEKLYEHIYITHKPVAESFKCNLCSQTFECENILNDHKMSFHRVEMNPSSSLVIPVLDINQPDLVTSLRTMGVSNYLPVTQLDRQDGNYVAPIMNISRPGTIESLKYTNFFNLGCIKKNT